jgi:hypothetical protein
MKLKKAVSESAFVPVMNSCGLLFLVVIHNRHDIVNEKVCSARTFAQQNCIVLLQRKEPELL